MLLREFIYFNKEEQNLQKDNRYSPMNDTSVWKSSNTRNIRLTLGMINDMRKAGEAHDKEMREEHGLIRKMYAVPAPQEGQPPPM